MPTPQDESICVRPVRPDDREGWLPLWHGYQTFYANDPGEEVTQATWNRFFDDKEPVHALVAERAGKLVGTAHYLFHRNTWTIEPVCYLQDLFTAPEARGQGVGRGLIEAVYAAAGLAGSERVYWMTHETNTTAQALYNRIAERSGFIVYWKSLAL